VWEADPDWGMFVWLTMTTGVRRGELCALRWSHVDLLTGALTVERAIAQDGRYREEKDTKTHQQRRVALDPETAVLLGEHRERCRSRAEAIGVDERVLRGEMVVEAAARQSGRRPEGLNVGRH
jgi:integrase